MRLALKELGRNAIPSKQAETAENPADDGRGGQAKPLQ